MLPFSQAWRDFHIYDEFQDVNPHQKFWLLTNNLYTAGAHTSKGVLQMTFPPLFGTIPHPADVTPSFLLVLISFQSYLALFGKLFLKTTPKLLKLDKFLPVKG